MTNRSETGERLPDSLSDALHTTPEAIAEIYGPGTNQQTPSEQEIHDESEEKKEMSRREFIRLSLGALGALGTAATVGALVKELGDEKKRKKYVSKVIGVSEVGRSFIESHRSYETDRVEIVQEEALRETELYSISRLTVNVEGSGKPFHPVKVTFNGTYQAHLAEVPSTYKRDLLNSENSGNSENLLVCPTTYVVGRYHYDELEGGETPILDTGLTTMVSLGITFGPAAVEDRFPGLSPEINEASGGIALVDNKLRLCNKTELIRYKAQKTPHMQMVFYVDQDNETYLLKEKWRHFAFEAEIGNTSYYWGAYYEIPTKTGTETGFIVVDQEMVPLTNLVKTVKAMSETGEYKFVLVDAGNGSSILGKEGNEEFAYGANEFETHLSPVTLIIE
ncbi:hypothetical protein JXA34_03380 [Patescibacteria group bacterium]|nr:hypothetical protein [Patescibacteria group bacterium]